MGKTFNPTLTGIILAGGKSSRMGTPKGLLKWNGKTLIEHSVGKLKPWCDELLLSANTNDYDNQNITIVNDEIKKIGPIAGILACLKKSSNSLNFVLSCDIPMVSEHLIRYLLSNVNPSRIVVPRFNGKIEPLCGIYLKELVPLLEDAISTKSYGIQSFILQNKPIILDVDLHFPFYHPNLFLNINSPSDFGLLDSLSL